MYNDSLLYKKEIGLLMLNITKASITTVLLLALMLLSLFILNAK